jgi:folate-dependent phosphoribosylglycinamide formyltransferase PurN
LQALLDAEKHGVLAHGRIVKVITDRPDAYALVRPRAMAFPPSGCKKGQTAGDVRASVA